MSTGRLGAGDTAIQPTILDAKGDLLTATAADTPASLAVGNNGETLVADSSQTTGLRWQGNFAAGKNKIINGDFNIWQRGTSIVNSSATNVYTADRWFIYSGTSNKTVSRQTTGDTTNLPNIQYCARVQRNNTSSNTDIIYFAQSLETSDSIPFVGRTVTLSFYARAGSNFSSASNVLTAAVNTGTGVDQNNITTYTGLATPASNAFTLTTTWQRFSVSGTIATSATEIGIRIYYTPSGTAGANDFFEITGVQLEVGAVATPFQTATGTLAGELAACQRYYYKVTPTATYQDILNGSTNDSTAYARYCMKFPVTMRTAPTMGTTGTAGDYGNLVKTGFAGATGVPTSNDSRVDGITIYLTSASIATGDAPCLRNSTGGVNSNNWLTFSSEL